MINAVIKFILELAFYIVWVLFWTVVTPFILLLALIMWAIGAGKKVAYPDEEYDM